MKVSVIASVVVVASILVASGCAEKSGSPVSESAHAAARQKAEAIRYKKVEIDTDAGGFSFEPSRCSIYEEAGSPAYSIQGRGLAPDKQPVYVTIEDEDGDSSTGADVRIHVGVDAPFKSGDPNWISNDQQSLSLGVAKSQATIVGDVLTITGVAFGKEYGGQLMVNAPIRVDCTR